MSPKRIGHMLKKLRERRGMNMAQLAAKADVTDAYIAMLETGVRKNPSLATLRRIAKALKVTVGELLE